MARIQKGFALSTAIIGFLCFLFGAAVAICAWVISAKLPSNFSFSDDTTTVRSSGSDSFNSYWWGGIFFVVPGFLGIVAGCTRNVVVMVFFLIFNMICLLCSLAVSVMGALAIVLWSNFNTALHDNGCHDLSGNCYCTQSGKIYTIYNTKCNNLYDIQTIFGAMVSMAAISTLLAFIASYISCCALCNQESDYPSVIIQQGPGAYQPPPMVVSHTNSAMMGGNIGMGHPAYPPAGYAYPPADGAYPAASGAYPPPYVQNSTSDKSGLVKNEVV